MARSILRIGGEIGQNRVEEDAHSDMLFCSNAHWLGVIRRIIEDKEYREAVASELKKRK
tara:strand:- start:444 stop:620 length:177 start_codon:yes stop_codon:yes gene_type:complete